QTHPSNHPNEAGGQAHPSNHPNEAAPPFAIFEGWETTTVSIMGSPELRTEALNRIATASTQGPGWGESFTIDPWGNLSNRTVTKCEAEPLSVAVLNNNRLSGFGYDAAGNMTSNGSATYTYNAEAQLTATDGVTYTYDGDGNRVKKSNGTEYWGGGPLAESDGSGNLQREFIFAGGSRIARRDLPDGTVHYFFSDQVGSLHVETTSTGSIQSDSDYYPYGGERVYVAGMSNQHYKFDGKERDPESGLDNFGARYDSSNLGRFMTPDWAVRPTAVPYANFGNPQTLNLYAFVANDPISRADADGHQTDATPQCGMAQLCNPWETSHTNAK